MTKIPPDMQVRRIIEDRLARLGTKRAKLENEQAENIEAIVDAIPDAIGAGIPFDAVARLVGISRQTLYRWQEVARRLRADR
jgi:DNA invertase Pin-like site-specific DNA recombinase